MKKTLILAAALILAMSLLGCDMIDKLKPPRNAATGDKVEEDGAEINDGARVSVVSATDTSLVVKIENVSDSTWQSGNFRDYSLEVEKDGEWYEVKQVGELANTMELMIFSPGKSVTHTFEFSDRYGRLGAGKYRIVKSFWANATATEDAHEFKLVCEFVVE